MRSLYFRAIVSVRGWLGSNWSDAQTHKTSHFRFWLKSLLWPWDWKFLVNNDKPWWVMSAANYLDGELKSNRFSRGFEYGSGASTFWLAKRVTNLVSTEHDSLWFEEIRHSNPQ